MKAWDIKELEYASSLRSEKVQAEASRQVVATLLALNLKQSGELFMLKNKLLHP